MYFRNKFNKEIQQLIRNMDEWGAKTRIGNFNSNLFEKRQVKTKDWSSPYVKIYPLVMYDSLQSSYDEDIVYNNSDINKNRYSGVILAKNRSGTIISCGRDEK
ncbi:hypothetical protein [Methanosphaera sp.]|jgi:hypothetical protein|uniref:hypothetical protein n=1 Tax=Methanosphaera sp. TaxID=2666342 RepID=UPI003D90B07E